MDVEGDCPNSQAQTLGRGESSSSGTPHFRSQSRPRLPAKVCFPTRAVGEVEHTSFRNASHIWYFLGNPAPATTYDLTMFGKSGDVFYDSQRRYFVRDMVALHDFYLANAMLVLSYENAK